MKKFLLVCISIVMVVSCSGKENKQEFIKRFFSSVKLTNGKIIDINCAMDIVNKQFSDNEINLLFEFSKADIDSTYSPKIDEKDMVPLGKILTHINNQCSRNKID